MAVVESPPVEKKKQPKQVSSRLSKDEFLDKAQAFLAAKKEEEERLDQQQAERQQEQQQEQQEQQQRSSKIPLWLQRTRSGQFLKKDD